MRRHKRSAPLDVPPGVQPLLAARGLRAGFAAATVAGLLVAATPAQALDADHRVGARPIVGAAGRDADLRPAPRGTLLAPMRPPPACLTVRIVPVEHRDAPPQDQPQNHLGPAPRGSGGSLLRPCAGDVLVPEVPPRPWQGPPSVVPVDRYPLGQPPWAGH